MILNRRLLILISISVLFLALALAGELLYFSDFEHSFRTRRFNRILHEKEKIMDQCLKSLEPLLYLSQHHGSITEEEVFRIAEKNDITILEYLDGRLHYWSDNDFDVPAEISDSTYALPFIFIQNGWFVPRTMRASNQLIVALLRVRTEYGFENDIIRNGFDKDFRIRENAGLDISGERSPYKVLDSRGRFLFSISFPESGSNTPLIALPLSLLALFLMMFILMVNEAAGVLTARYRGKAGILLSLFLFAALYGLLLLTSKPEILFRTELFSSHVFTINGFIPSLGHLLLLSIFSADLAWLIYKHIPAGEGYPGKPVINRFTIGFLLFVSLMLLYGSHIIFRSLVRDSNISFEAYKVLTISAYSITAYASVILLLLVPFFLILKAAGMMRSMKEGKPGSGFRFTGQNTSFGLTALFSIVVGIYALYMITVYSEEKNIGKMKIQALSFSSENDPEAEHRLLDLWPDIKNDSLLKAMMVKDYFQEDYQAISSYLRETYFNGYWGNYNYSISLCRKDDPLELLQTGEMVDNCFSFFSERIRKYGHQLAGTDFWFIDNQGGRSYYFGQFFFGKSEEITNGLFIELYSDVNVFQPGYSELLVDRKFRGYSGLREYSFVKYINGEVVFTSGEFPYDKSDVDYIDKNSDYRIFNGGGFKHILYRNGNATVILSKPRINTGNILITFAYLFAFTFLFTNILLLITGKWSVSRLRSLNFRQKLQMTFTGILLFSFILVGIVITYLTVNEYKSKHYENVTEKMNSIYLELEGKVGNEELLTGEWRNSSYSSLNDLLIRFSNIFNTDINLYNTNGFLIATSREEIFTRDLTATRMNNEAMNNLRVLTKSLYSHTETIGRLTYISVYTPFYNFENKVLAYLNLPYFRMQSILAREVSNLVVAVINFTLLLVLATMGLAFFISGRLTSPLSMLSEGLASVELGKKSKHLEYKDADEIGELVKQYNRMVDELDESARKLADSEREYAWREMAKQIAHEIKNPLTPMKLNVQQLLKSWKDGIPDFNEKIEAFSKNQIEYIDNLSAIASAFSSFAKMPGANPAEVDLLEQVKSTLELFSNTDNVSFDVIWPHERKVYILADRDHLNGIFSNLFKNSIQAIPAGRKGMIRVTMEVVRNKVLVSVSDNGEGIPEDLKKKMFTPNFTTKSSGTGLGLSIVKRYAESAGGRVWFESEAGKGTVFHLEFPLMYTVEKPQNPHAD
jgi:signal transduction histidine kinase